MANLIEQVVACDDGDRAARMIQKALGNESDDVANYVVRPVNSKAASSITKAPGMTKQCEVKDRPTDTTSLLALPRLR